MAKKDKGKRKEALKANAPVSAPSKKATRAESAAFSIKSILVPAIMLVLGILTYVSFAPSLTNDFTDWDDPTYVTENPMVQTRETQWDKIFTKSVSNNYHPLTMLTLAWNYQSAAKKGNSVDPVGFHAENVWLHVFNTLLVFYFIWLLSGKQLVTSAFTAAIFGIHPMHVESVSWISERKDVLYVFFFLLSCITYLYYLDKKNILFLVLCFALFVLSCLAKGMAVVLPLVLIIIDYFKARKLDWKLVADKVPFLAMSLYFGIKTYHVQSESIASTEVFTLWQRLMFGSYGAMMYVSKFFVPTDLSAFYPYPTTQHDGDVPFIFHIAPAIWVVFGLLFWLGFKKNRAIVFGLAFYIITVVLVLQFLSVGSAIMADRYTYLSYIGIAFIIGSLCDLLVKKYTSSAIAVYLACTIFVLFLSFETYSRTQVWKNSEVLWTDVISKYPTVEVAYKNRGKYYGHEMGDIDKAYKDYQVIKAMNPKDSRAFSNMGNIYGIRKQTDSALWAFNKAIVLDPRNDDAYMNRAITYSMIKEYDKALADFNKYEQLQGPSAMLSQNRAFTYLVAGKYQESIDDYNKVIKANPNAPANYYYRGLAYEQLNNPALALQDVQTASTLGYKVEGDVLQRLQNKVRK